MRREACLAEYLGRYIELSELERVALDGIVTGARHYRRGAVVRAEHGAPGDVMVVLGGWLFSSALLEDGRRQIVRLHFRGDLLGLDGLAFAEAPDTITALTDADVCVVDSAALGRVFADHPRIGALLFAAQQIERVTLTERLVSLGRASAKGRVAALLMWVASRMRAADMPVDDGFILPLTQEEIGDLTGLTAVHVNRTLRALAEQGLITRTGGVLRIPDVARLARLANHTPRRETIDLGWLPPAR
jgi:CRP/FNR family transcriptional regulator, anaerobic regulatory protein